MHEKSIMDLHAFVFRIYPNTLTQLMLDVLKASKQTQKFLKATPSGTINFVFEKKNNFIFFIRTVLAQLDTDIRDANHNLVALVTAVTNCYNTKYGPTHEVKALNEVNYYIGALSMATYDWRALLSVVSVPIADPKIGHILFYQFVNECAELAVQRQMSINTAFEATHLRQKYDLLKLKEQSDKHLWYESIFMDYDFNDYAKNKILTKKLKETFVFDENTFTSLFVGDDSLESDLLSDSTKSKKGRKSAKAKRMEIIHNWLRTTPDRVKSKYKTAFGNGKDFCAGHHIAQLSCKSSGDKCTINKIERSHICLCKKRGHPMSDCTEIWQ